MLYRAQCLANRHAIGELGQTFWQNTGIKLIWGYGYGKLAERAWEGNFLSAGPYVPCCPGQQRYNGKLNMVKKGIFLSKIKFICIFLATRWLHRN